MNNFHIHVYRVIGVQEFDIPAEDAADANERALEIANMKHNAADQETPWHEPDCRMIAVTVKGGPNE